MKMDFEVRLRFAARRMCEEENVRPNHLMSDGKLEWEARADLLRGPLRAALPDVFQFQHCRHCGEEFVSKGERKGQRNTRLFCSNSCRVAAQRKAAALAEGRVVLGRGQWLRKALKKSSEAA